MRELEKLDITRCREILGPWAARMSDADVESLRDRLYRLADLVFEAAHVSAIRENLQDVRGSVK